jgi:hypothetical protein
MPLIYSVAKNKITPPQPPRPPQYRPPPRPDLDATNANPMRTLARAVVALGLNAIEASNPAHDYVRPHLADDAIA